MDYLFRVSPGATLHHEQVALHGGLCYRLFCSLPRNSSVSTWPTRRYITISKKCFSCKSKQSVYKRELPWKLPILLVTRLEFWISSSRYLHNIIRYLTGCVHSGALEREFSFWRPCLLLIYKTLQCLYSPPAVFWGAWVTLARRGSGKLTASFKGHELSELDDRRTFAILFVKPKSLFYKVARGQWRKWIS